MNTEYDYFDNLTIEEVDIIVSYDGSGFDASQLRYATTVEVDGQLYLYYAGLPFGNSFDLGLATSSDGGETWTKVSDSPLIDRSTSPEFASFRIYPLTVIYEDGKFKLWYGGNNTNSFGATNNINGFGYAESTDGINWVLDEEPIRAETGSREGSRLNEVVKLGNSYLAYYEDFSLNSAGVGEVEGTYLAISTDGRTFSSPDQLIPFGQNFSLQAATTFSDDPDCVISIWKSQITSEYIVATSKNGIDFEIVSSLDLPDGFVPGDLIVEGGSISIYGSQNFGPVIWSFNNSSIGVATVQLFDESSDRTLVFADDFNRPDSLVVGNGWAELQEIQPENPAYTGSAVLNIQDNKLEFVLDAEGVSPPRLTQTLLPTMAHDLQIDLSDYGFELHYEFTPGDDERIFMTVAVADSSTGQQLVGGELIANSYVGLQVVRSDNLISNSQVQIIAADGDGASTQILESHLTSFQFEDTDTISVSFRVELDGSYEILLTNNTSTDTFSGMIEPLDSPLDQILLWGGGQISFYGNQTEVVAFDNLKVFALGDLDPEVASFEFNVKTAMQLAAAAYAPVEISPEGPDNGESDREEQTELYNLLFNGSTDLELATDLVGVDSNGFYINQNAAALVARTDDALIISFRGTNDNTGTIGALADSFKINLTSAAANVGSQQTGPLAAINGLQKAQGKSKSGRPAEVFDEKISRHVVPDEYDSPDVAHWFGLKDDHWALFSDLMISIEDYVTNTGLEKVYFTGHSLGGRMVQQAMLSETFKVGTELDVEAYAYAPPGIGFGIGSSDDARLLNLIFDNDPLNPANIFTDTVGDTLLIDSDGTGSHAPSDYLRASEILLDAGFATGDRLDNPANPGTELGDEVLPRMEIVGLRLDNELPILTDVQEPQDGVFGTNGNDEIDLSSDLIGLISNQGFKVVGREGDDTIDLSSGEDVIVFRKGDGRDTVQDFNLAEDLIVFYGFGPSIQTQLSQINGNIPFTYDTTLSFGDGDSITFSGFKIEDVEVLMQDRSIPTQLFDDMPII